MEWMVLAVGLFSHSNSMQDQLEVQADGWAEAETLVAVDELLVAFRMDTLIESVVLVNQLIYLVPIDFRFEEVGMMEVEELRVVGTMMVEHVLVPDN